MAEVAPDLNAAVVAADVAAPAAPAQPDALTIAAAAARAERDTRKAMKMENRHGELTPPSEPVDGATWVVPKKLKDGKPHYCTIIHIGAEKIYLKSYSDAEKEKAVKLWKAVQDANPTSFTNQRKRKAEREAANAEKRAKDVETHGDNCKLERDVLNANEKALTSDGVLVFLVLMLQTVADAVTRIAAMPKDTYLRVQEKTTGKIKERGDGKREYQFNDVTGYSTCLMVFQCQADNATFVAYGNDVEDAFKTRKSDNFSVTISKHDNKKRGWVKDEPILDCMPWLTYLGKGNEAYVNLQQWLVEQCEKKTPSLRVNSSLPLCTIREANSELGKNHAKEESGIKAHILVEHGGIVPENDPRWKGLDPRWQRNKHIYMLTEKHGDVVAYPEHTQNGKVDIYVYLKKYNYEVYEKWQYKTAGPISRQNGSLVNMRTANGRGLTPSNTYEDGDNDLYCAVRIDGNVVHYWTLTNAEMLEKNYIGEGAPGSFYVYKKNKKCAKVRTRGLTRGHAWTWEKHRSARIKYRDGLPVLAE